MYFNRPFDWMRNDVKNRIFFIGLSPFSTRNENKEVGPFGENTLVCIRVSQYLLWCQETFWPECVTVSRLTHNNCFDIHVPHCFVWRQESFSHPYVTVFHLTSRIVLPAMFLVWYQESFWRPCQYSLIWRQKSLAPMSFNVSFEAKCLHFLLDFRSK